MTDEKRTHDQKTGSADPAAGDAVTTLAPWLVALLACPIDRAAVLLSGSDLVCSVCGRRYAVRDGIPVMLADEAQSEQEF